VIACHDGNVVLSSEIAGILVPGASGSDYETPVFSPTTQGCPLAVFVSAQRSVALPYFRERFGAVVTFRISRDSPGSRHLH
jgi:hypothetical protein